MCVPNSPILNNVWGLFRKRNNSDDTPSGESPVPSADTNETEEIELDDSGDRDLAEGVGVGEHPAAWVDQALAARGDRPVDIDLDDASSTASDDDDPAGDAVIDDNADTRADSGAPSAAAEGRVTDEPSAGIGGAALDDPLEIGRPEDAGDRPVDATDATDAAPASDPHRELPAQTPDPREEVRQRWLSELAELGGTSSLRHFRGDRGTYVDLTTAHPSGVATLLAGRPVMLTSLLREPLAFRNALDAADLVALKGAELEASRALSAVQLAIGLASWTTSGGGVRCPVFLRAATLRRLGRDYEVRLRGRLQPNVTLLQSLHNDGVTVRASALLAEAGDGDTLVPEGAFELLRSAAAGLPGFIVDARAALSTFGDVAGAMLADAADLAHPVLDALTGHAGARSALTTTIELETPTNPDRRDPSTDRLLLDADTEQERVVDAILGGSNLVVETLPGTGLTQTVVNAIGQLVDRDRRVLVVTPRAASIRAIRSRLRGAGLDGLAITPRTVRRDSIAAIARNERAQRPSTAELDDALVRLRHVLADYRSALTRVSPRYGVSPFQVLEQLSALELLEVPPTTTARLDDATLAALAKPADRAELAERLRELSRLGAFRFGPDDSPWFGVMFSSTDEVGRTHELANRLTDGRVEAVIATGRGIVAQTNLRPPESFGQLGVYLRLLADIRETLDRFHAEVFDADLPALIEATGSRRDGSDMPASRRRELRAIARDLVRPGVVVSDLHETLKFVHRQRILWHRYVNDGALPNVPVGIESARADYRAVAAELQQIDDFLQDADASTLVDTPIDELPERLRGLAAESEYLHAVVERLAITEELRARGLAPLLDDLLERRIEGEHVGDELEQAWWQSVLERQLQDEKGLLNANTRILTRLENDFRVVDEAHTASSAEQLVWQFAQAWKVGLIDYADEADALRELLRAPGVGARTLVERAPKLSRSIAQVWVSTPYDVPRIDDRIEFDTVLLVDAGDMSTTEAVGAIRRGRQVVAFGDPVTQAPAPFSIAVRPRTESQPARGLDADAIRERAADSVYARLAEFLPLMSLTRSYRAGGEDLVELVNHRFYGGRLEAMPWAGAFLGHSSLTYSYVADGTGMPDSRTGNVEATDAEVQRVVELVIDHAIHRPRESLMVITASAAHAQRVEQAVWSALSLRNEVVDFFTGPRKEPFLVMTIEQASALARDRVIFSLGYGITPHGRVLSDFGVLATPMGERALAVAMTRARRSLVIVSCIRPDQLDLSKMTAGTIGLAEILTELEERTERPGRLAPLDETKAPMLVDLARRLSGLGMRVDLDYRGRIPLVASFGPRAIAIDLDAVDTEEAPTLREQLRLRPELLKRLGWYYLRVHAFELFANPESVARRIAVALEVPLPDAEGVAAAALPAGSPPAALDAGATADAVGRELEAGASTRPADGVAQDETAPTEGADAAEPETAAPEQDAVGPDLDATAPETRPSASATDGEPAEEES